MKKSLACVFALTLFSTLVQARTVYVTDNVEVPLRASENDRSKIVKMLVNGAPLTVLNEYDSGYSYVQTNTGTEGFILTRYLSNEPISRVQLEAATSKLDALQEENKQLKAKLSTEQDVGKQRDRLNTELTELQQNCTNAIQLKQQRDHLQERAIAMERELQQLKHENQMLADSTNQDWFLYGGGLALFGVLLGFILPKLSWRRRSSGWDTF